MNKHRSRIKQGRLIEEWCQKTLKSCLSVWLAPCPQHLSLLLLLVSTSSLPHFWTFTKTESINHCSPELRSYALSALAHTQHAATCTVCCLPCTDAFAPRNTSLSYQTPHHSPITPYSHLSKSTERLTKKVRKMDIAITWTLHACIIWTLCTSIFCFSNMQWFSFS